jgi:hypothetical protein
VRIFRKLTYANVVATLALALALTGGIAYAANTVFSADIVDGEVKAVDLNSRALTQAWNLVGKPGQPPFVHSDICDWHNYDTVHSVAAFQRDRAGFVHLKGTVQLSSMHTTCFLVPTEGARIFTLPPGYRPAAREQFATPTNEKLGSIVVDGRSLEANLPAGSVWVAPPTDPGDAQAYVALDGISFRCAPSGVNGCP